MKKIVLFLLLATGAFGQVNFVRTAGPATVQLTTVNDIDSLLLLFPKNLTSPAFFDSTKANRTVIIPAQDFVACAGQFTLYIQRVAIGGSNIDSIRIFVKKLMPQTGIPVHNDSIWVAGSATTYANPINQSAYSFTVTDPTKGLMFGVVKADGGLAQKVRFNFWVDYTQ